MMLTICDTSPLLYLHLVGQLELLHLLYNEIVIPPAVQSELVVGANQGVNVPEPLQISWIRVIPVQAQALMPIVTDLGLGESEVIGLALEHPGSRIIMDDQLGRHIVAANQMTLTGTLGVLLKAKQAGHLNEIKMLLNALRTAGLWMSDILVESVLSQANEA
ncbi:hypothetical protein THIOM_001263 [Candidatus Thiomargarita nelsonii]|uniref:DUF3368 domain-containing protein n=1 Tax=Candidatus Thiomargarita nelsonii TaxID=1003181 RepID=A0A0A6P172_9GAMM|nr:hypothetical protein THIOM_001263 [Candidatus Thiomargarita nelsonii]